MANTTKDRPINDNYENEQKNSYVQFTEDNQEEQDMNHSFRAEDTFGYDEKESAMDQARAHEHQAFEQTQDDPNQAGYQQVNNDTLKQH